MSYDNTPYRTPPAYGEDGVQYNRFGIPIGTTAGPAPGAGPFAPAVAQAPEEQAPAWQATSGPAPVGQPVGPAPWEAQAEAAWRMPATATAAPPAWGPPAVPAHGGPSWGPPAMPRKGAVIVAGTSYDCASWGLRVGSSIVDGLLLGLVSGVASLLGDAAGNIAWVVFGVWNAIYLQGTTGQTLGKRVVGTQLVRKVRRHPGTEHLVAPGPATALLRRFAQILDSLSLGVGYLAPLWTQRRQTFGDLLSQTVVIKASSPIALTTAAPNDQSATW